MLGWSKPTARRWWLVRPTSSRSSRRCFDRDTSNSPSPCFNLGRVRSSDLGLSPSPIGIWVVLSSTDIDKPKSPTSEGMAGDHSRANKGSSSRCAMHDARCSKWAVGHQKHDILGRHERGRKVGVEPFGPNDKEELGATFGIAVRFFQGVGSSEIYMQPFGNM